jgi:hypothetical protein
MKQKQIMIRKAKRLKISYTNNLQKKRRYFHAVNLEVSRCKDFLSPSHACGPPLT